MAQTQARTQDGTHAIDSLTIRKIQLKMQLSGVIFRSPALSYQLFS